MLMSITNAHANRVAHIDYVNLPFRSSPGNAYRVTLHDLDSNNYVGVQQFFSTLDLATAYAKKLTQRKVQS